MCINYTSIKLLKSSFHKYKHAEKKTLQCAKMRTVVFSGRWDYGYFHFSGFYIFISPNFLQDCALSWKIHNKSVCVYVCTYTNVNNKRWIEMTVVFPGAVLLRWVTREYPLVWVPYFWLGKSARAWTQRLCRAGWQLLTWGPCWETRCYSGLKTRWNNSWWGNLEARTLSLGSTVGLWGALNLPQTVCRTVSTCSVLGRGHPHLSSDS